VLGISRMFFAMARRRDLPAALERVHPVHGVPTLGVFLTGGIMVLLALFGTLEWVIAAAAFTILLYYSIANVAALRMDRADKLFPDWIAGLGLGCCLLLAFSLRPATILSGFTVLAAGFLARAVCRRFNR
jgi:APA family basic amino acid/polyamine antiporter